MSHPTSASPGGRVAFRWAPAALPLLVAALAYGVVAVGFGLARGGRFALTGPHLAFVGGITVAAALVVALAGAHPRAARVGPALWVGLHIALLADPAWGLGTGVLTLVLLRPDRGSPIARGLLIALALTVALIPLPRLMLRLPSLSPYTPALVAVATLAVLAAGSWLQPRLGRVAPVALYGLGLLLTALSPLLGRAPSPPIELAGGKGTAEARQDVILLIADTLRADRLSLYGYTRPTTPALERFVEGHPGTVVYPYAFSTATWTLPAHVSLFTGLLASEHGVHEEVLFDARGVPQQAQLRAKTTLAEVARGQGYATALVFANGWLSNVVGLERGFEHFEQPRTVDQLPLLGEEVRRRLLPSWFRTQPVLGAQVSAGLLRFLDACRPGPCLAVGNYMDTHAPYIPAAAHLGRFGDGRAEPAERPYYGDSSDHLRHLSGLYDETVRTLDDELSALFVALEERGRLRDAWVIITSDHGEAFGEHGEVEHSSALYNEVTHVPLVIKPPEGVALEKVAGAVDLLDVARTIAAITGAEAPLGRGRDLRAPLAAPRPVLVEMFNNTNKPERDQGARAGHPGRAVARGTLKMVDHNGVVELFDLARDPSEQQNLVQAQAALADELRPLLTGKRLPAAPPPPAPADMPLSREQANRLRALGYVQ